MDVDQRTVQRSVKKMEGLGYVRRIARRAAVGDNLSNEYDLSGLVSALTMQSRAILEEKARRDAEDTARRTTPTTLALVSGGKK